MSIQAFFQTPLGRVIAGAIICTGIAVVALAIFKSDDQGQALSLSTDRLYICSETGKSFLHHLEVGESIPVKSPFTNRNTGYEAELCWWTADGKIRSEPFPVLLNQYVNLPEPTYCPDCGRRVVPHNPRPNPGDQAPSPSPSFKSK